MKTYNIALIGFGNVAQGLTRILATDKDRLAAEFGVEFKIVAVSSLSKGSLYNPAALDPATLLAAMETAGTLNEVAAPHHNWDAMQTIQRSNADIVVEVSYTDLQHGEPALSHIRQALTLARHVVTANKGPIALFYPALAELAHTQGVGLGIEGTVMSGTPALTLATDTLKAADIQGMRGILNGTTNYMLSKMLAGDDYTQALAAAQAKGYAEADPSGDVDGHDAAAKVVILANLLLGQSLTLANVPCQGIRDITPAAIADATANGQRWKLLGEISRTANGVTAAVKPVRLPLTDPLAAVGGATNAITFNTRLLGDITLVGPGAGRLETGYALLTDLLSIHRNFGG